MAAGGTRLRIGGAIITLALIGAMFLVPARPALGDPVVHSEVASWHVVDQIGPRTFALRADPELCTEWKPMIEAVEVDSIAQPNGIHRAVVTVRETWETPNFERSTYYGPRNPCESFGHPEFTVTLKSRLRHTRLYDASLYPHPGRGICPEGVKRWTPTGMAVCNQLDQPG